jgi:hypothetical protein
MKTLKCMLTPVYFNNKCNYSAKKGVVPLNKIEWPLAYDRGEWAFGTKNETIFFYPYMHIVMIITLTRAS